MNNVDLEYNRLLSLILTKGKRKKNRTGVDTIGVFGAQARFDLSEGFPILTTKKVFTKGIIHELLWFLKGDTNIKYLVDNDVHIWDSDCYRKYTEIKSKNDGDVSEMVFEPTTNAYRMLRKDEFIDGIKRNDDFAKKWGELGQGTYGQMWRAFPYYLPEYTPDNGTGLLRTVDQIQKVIDKLKTNPDDRRMIVTAWHPVLVDKATLPPCHCMFHFNTEELTLEERSILQIKEIGKNPTRPTFDLATLNGEKSLDTYLDEVGIPKRRLNVLLYQRSCDTFLGVPFNITSYALLLSMISQVVNMVPGEFIHTFGDLHIYENHLEQVKEQLSRTPKTLPKLVLNPEVKDLFKFTYNDIKIEGYDPHPAIKGEVSTG
jgi:thymidylate synthase